MKDIPVDQSKTSGDERAAIDSSAAVCGECGEILVKRIVKQCGHNVREVFCANGCDADIPFFGDETLDARWSRTE